MQNAKLENLCKKARLGLFTSSWMTVCSLVLRIQTKFQGGINLFNSDPFFLIFQLFYRHSKFQTIMAQFLLDKNYLPAPFCAFLNFGSGPGVNYFIFVLLILFIICRCSWQVKRCHRLFSLTVIAI